MGNCVENLKNLFELFLGRELSLLEMENFFYEGFLILENKF